MAACIIAIDPGISTGVAIHTTTGEYLTVVITDVPKLWEIISHHNPLVLCYENFASGGLISKDGQQTLRLIGAIEAICYHNGIPTALQFPQERYAMIHQARQMLKQLGRTPISHEVDALAHLLLYEDRVSRGLQDALNARRQRQI